MGTRSGTTRLYSCVSKPTCPNCFGLVNRRYGARVSAPLTVQLPGEVAGLWRRLGAITIDWVASMLVASLVFPGLRPWGENASLPILLVFFVEVTLFTWMFASSFGQRILGVEVVDLFGARLPLWRIVLRTLLICLVIPAVVIDSNGRGLHDRAAGSIAIRRRPLGAAG